MLNGGYCLLLSLSYLHVAELVAVKRMYEDKVFEMEKLKQKPEKSRIIFAKVCLLLAVSCFHSMDKWGSLLLMYFLSCFNEGTSLHF